MITMFDPNKVLRYIYIKNDNKCDWPGLECGLMYPLFVACG